MTTIAPPLPVSAQRLLIAAVDVEGLAPPGVRTVADAVTHYAEELRGPDAWMLGRLVSPASRLGELAAAHTDALGEGQLRSAGRARWRVSGILGSDVERDLAAIAAFNARAQGVVVDAIETQAATADEVDRIAARVMPGFSVYIEVSLLTDPTPVVRQIAAHGLFGKVRTGGVTVHGIPEPDALLAFLVAAVQAGLPFKATAALHHPVRGEYRLNDADAAPHATMYGYLNVMLATAALREGWSREHARAILVEGDPSAFAFRPRLVSWRGRSLEADVLEAMRIASVHSFGSASFRESAQEIESIIRPAA